MIRVLFVSPSGDVTGAEKSMLTLMAHLSRERYSCILLCPWDGSLAARCRDLSIPVLVAPLTRLTTWEGAGSVLRNVASSVRLAFRFARYLRDERIDLLHINSVRVALGPGLAARLVRVPTIWHIHHIPVSPVKRRLMALLASLLADRIIAVSKAVREMFVLGSRRVGRVTVVYNGLEPTSVVGTRTRESLRAELGIPESAFLVGAVGQLLPAKGHHVLLRAAALVREKHRDVRFVIAGGPVPAADRSPEASAYPAEIERLRETLGLGETVRLLGFRADVPDLLGAMDLFVHPAIHPDPLPYAVLEAMAAGIPLVCSDVGGIPEIVAASPSARLIPPGDVPALAQAILALASDIGLRTSPPKAASLAEGRFSVEAQVAATEAVYREVISARRTWR